MMDFSPIHLLRPWYLLLLIPSWAFVWLLLKQQQNHTIWERLINKQFLPHLLIAQHKENVSKIPPAWHIGLLLTLLVIVLSGPAWQKQAQPFSDDKSELVFVLKVSKSMQEKDLRPDRLARAIFKIEDTLKNRSQIRAGLVAYNGSAHLVMPLTADQQILSTFAHALTPDLMPVKGDALADGIRLSLQQFSSSGSIIVITDSVDTEQIRQIKTDPKFKKARIILYAIASPELLNLKQMKQAAAEIDADLITFSPDDSDIEALLKTIETNFQRAQNEQADYQDGGYYLLPLIALLVLLWFRRGFLAEAWRLQ